MNLTRIERASLNLVLVFTFLLANRYVWLCLTDVRNPVSYCTYNNPAAEVALYLSISCIAIWLLVRRGLLASFLASWRANWVLPLFIFFSALSLGWSVLFWSTLQHVLVLVFVSLLGAFVGIYISPKQWLTALSDFAGVVVISSFVLLLFLPTAATMTVPQAGAWRGIFWHKNFAGSIVAFGNMVFLLSILTTPRGRRWRLALFIALYLLSLIFVLLSQSATGVAICIFLNVAALALFAWTRLRARLTRTHYAILGLIIAAIIVISASRIQGVFHLLNRDSSFTGRVPLWSYSINTALTQAPFLGHGLGAIWYLQDFRTEVVRVIGWPFQITNAHNGFVDILLDLGIVGLALVVALCVLALYRTAKLFLGAGTMESALPLLTVVYFLMANVTISYILNLESFHWFLLVTSLFLATPRNSE